MKGRLWAIIFSIFAFAYIYGYLIFPNSLLFNRFLVGICINFMIFVIPGLSWIAFAKREFQHFGIFITYVLAISITALILGSILHMIIGISVSPYSLLTYLLIICSIGFWLSRNAVLQIPKIPITAIALGFLIYFSLYSAQTFMYWTAEDNFWYCTAPHIANKLQPGDSNKYFFAHPPLDHMFSAYSILLYDQMKELPETDTSNEHILDCGAYHPNVQKNFILATRTPHFFLAALVGVILFLILMQLSGSSFLSILGVVFYYTFYEVWVRATIMSYMVPTTAFLLLSTYVYIDTAKGTKKKKNFVPLYVLSFMLAWLNHKAIIFPIAIIIKEFVDNRNLKKIAQNPLFIGFASGTLLWWFYGLLLSAKNFIVQHFQYHIMHRFLHITDIETSTGYASLSGLWSELILGFSIPLFFISIFALIKALKNRKENVFFYWFIVGATVFSVVDWRSTKHLMLIMPALIIPLFVFMSKQRKIVKIVLICLVCIIVLLNIIAISQYGSNVLQLYIFRPNFDPSPGFT